MNLTITLVIIWIAYLISLYYVVFWTLTLLESDRVRKRKLTYFPTVTIAIPAYNEASRSREALRKTIQSVLNLDYPREKLEIIAVNHGSADDTLQVITEFSHKIKILDIKHSENERKGAALNAALKVTKSEYFICLDADSYIEKNALLKLLPHFEEDENIACVLPLMKITTPRNWLQRVQWTEYCVNLFYKKLMSKLNCIHVAPGPFSIYKTSIVKKLGGWDANNLTEDLEISLRLQREHYRLVQSFDATVYTETPGNLIDFYKQRKRWYKGAILNAFRFKKMAFNRAYGDFGLIQMPRVLIAGILAITLIAITSYNYVFKPVLNKLIMYSHVNFDFSLGWKTFWENFAIIDYNFTNIFFAAVAFAFSFYLLNMALKKTGERFTRYGYTSVPIYLVSYSLLSTIAWFIVFLDIALRRKQKW